MKWIADVFARLLDALLPCKSGGEGDGRQFPDVYAGNI